MFFRFFICSFIFIFNISFFVFSDSIEIPTHAKGQERREQMRSFAHTRMQKDYQYYSASELKKVEELYQVANEKSHTKEARNSLEELINMTQFNKANRMGCAYLYLATIKPQHPRHQEFLEEAINNYSDCWYGNGVQVGPYARYILAKYLLLKGNMKKANQLFSEIKENYPNSIDHLGNLLIDKIPQ